MFPARSPRRRWIAVLIGLAVGVLVAEATLRLLDLPDRWLSEMAPYVVNEGGLVQQDPSLLYRPRPGHCADCRDHDGPWTDVPRPITVVSPGIRRAAPQTPGAFRILAMGGSNTFGAETADGNTWPELLEARLQGGQRPVEVWNHGVSGWETRQKVAALRELIPQVRPDAILLQLHNLGPRFLLERSDARAYAAADPTLLNDWLPGTPPVGTSLRAGFDHIALARFVVYAVERQRRARNPEAGLPPRTIAGAHERGLADLRQWLAEEPGVPILVVIPVPGMQDRLPGALEDVRALGLPMVELGATPHGFGEEGDDIHPGARVHAWYAEQLEGPVRAWLN